jgi:hypothetical protein
MTKCDGFCTCGAIRQPGELRKHLLNLIVQLQIPSLPDLEKSHCREGLGNGPDSIDGVDPGWDFPAHVCPSETLGPDQISADHYPCGDSPYPIRFHVPGELLGKLGQRSFPLPRRGLPKGRLGPKEKE